MNPPRDSARRDDVFFAGDGTHGSSASDTFADPLSSLSSGYDESSHGDGYQQPTIASPVQPDQEQVSRMVSAALHEPGANTPEQDDLPAPAGPVAPPTVQPEQPLGMLPQQRNWPSGQAFRGGPRARVKSMQFKVPRPSLPRVSKPSSGSAGVIVAVVLLLAFVIVAIAMLSSLVNSISSLFN
jgi:hypothetical protein